MPCCQPQQFFGLCAVIACLARRTSEPLNLLGRPTSGAPIKRCKNLLIVGEHERGLCPKSAMFGSAYLAFQDAKTGISLGARGRDCFAKIWNALARFIRLPERAEKQCGFNHRVFALPLGNWTMSSSKATAGRLFFLDLSCGRVLSANPDGSDLKAIVNEGRRQQSEKHRS